MKKNVFYAATALALLLASPSYAAEGPYVRGAIGATINSDSDLNETSVPFAGEAEYDGGMNLGFALGTFVDQNIRAEVEGGYRANDADVTRNAVAGVRSGELTTWTGLINGYYDFMPENTVSPYLGAGFGFAYHTGEYTVPGFTTDDSDFGFAWQVGAGATVHANENLGVQGGYRYLGTSDLEFDTLEADYGAHEFTIGLIYTY